MAGKSLYLVELTLRDAESGDVYFTTSEEVAKEAGEYSERISYVPMLIVPGETELFSKVLERIFEAEEGESFKVRLSPEEAYGERDPGKVRAIPISRLKKAGIEPKIGERVEIDGKTGRISSITGGRVVVDFNHPLAGKELEVEVKIVKKLVSDEDIVKGAVADSFELDYEEVEVSFPEDGVVQIRLPSKASFMRDSFSRKMRSLSLIMKYTKDVRKVVFIEEFEIPRKEEVEEGGADST